MSILTSSDVVKFNYKDLDLLIEDVMDSTPFLKAAAARTVEGDVFKYTKVTANPAVGYRAVNAGISNTAASYGEVTCDLKFLDASFFVDVAAAKIDKRGANHIMAIEARHHLRAAMRQVEDNIFQTVSGGFAGLADQANLNNLADDQVLNAGGSTTAVTSVYGVKLGSADMEMLWGEGGVINIGPQQMVHHDTGSGKFWAYAHDVSAYCGLKVGGIHSVYRLANVQEGNDATKLTDAWLAELYSAAPIGYKPDVFVMNRDGERMLRESRTATNITGAPAPFVTEAFGVPVIVTDSIPTAVGEIVS
jgi:hypothetical protein